MYIIITNNKYRVISIDKKINVHIKHEQFIRYITNYKVQTKVGLFWITIKSFNQDEYDNDREFCEREAIELFHKIVNPYGNF